MFTIIIYLLVLNRKINLLIIINLNLFANVCQLKAGINETKSFHRSTDIALEELNNLGYKKNQKQTQRENRGNVQNNLSDHKSYKEITHFNFTFFSLPCVILSCYMPLMQCSLIYGKKLHSSSCSSPFNLTQHSAIFLILFFRRILPSVCNKSL